MRNFFNIILLILFFCFLSIGDNLLFGANIIESIQLYKGPDLISDKDIFTVPEHYFKTYTGEDLTNIQEIWLKIKINNSNLQSNNNYIHFYELFSQLSLFQNNKNDSLLKSLGGYELAASLRSSKHGLINDKLFFRKSESTTTTLFIKAIAENFRKDTPINCAVISEPQVKKMNSTNNSIQSIFTGIVFIISFLNFMLFILNREKLFFLYSLYTIVVSSFFLAHTQILEMLFFSNSPRIDQYFFFTLYIGMIIYAEFLYEAVKKSDLKKQKSTLKYYRYVLVKCSVVINLIAVMNIPIAIKVGDIFTVLNSIFLLFLIIWMYKSVSPVTKVILIGSQFIAIGGFLSLLADFMEYSPLNVYYYQAGFVIELMFFTVAINFMYHNTRLEKIRAQLQSARLEAKQLRVQKELTHIKIEVDKQNRELTNKAIVISQKEELIKQIMRKLSSASKNNQKNVEVEQIIRNIKSGLNNNGWHEFEYHFNKVHPNFYKELTEAYPLLTRNELKICAFLKLNLSTKEMAEVTGKSINTIDVARTRLRKKMQLNTSQNISTLIAQIG